MYIFQRFEQQLAPFIVDSAQFACKAKFLAWCSEDVKVRLRHGFCLACEDITLNDIWLELVLQHLLHITVFVATETMFDMDTGAGSGYA